MITLPYAVAHDEILRARTFAFVSIYYRDAMLPHVLHWLRYNNIRDHSGQFYHNTVAGARMHAFFADLDCRNRFADFIETLPITNPHEMRVMLFDKLGKCCSLAGSYQYRVEMLTQKELAVFYCWYKENFKGKLYEVGDTLLFQEADDLILFKLNFEGDKAKLDYSFLGIKT